MSAMIAFWTALSLGAGLSGLADPEAGTLKDLHVVPSEDRTEVVLGLDGGVTTRDFTMEGPTRLVVDLLGARHALSGEAFRDVARGGIRAIHASQYDDSVVRVVLELDALVDYTVQTGDGWVRISLENFSGEFDPWTPPPSNGLLAVAPASSLSDPAPVPERTRSGRGAIRGDEFARRITVSFIETPMRDVLFTFSEFAGRSIVPGSGVTGQVNAEIRDQPWDIALLAILESHGLAADEQASGIIRVDRLEDLSARSEVEPLVTRPFRISYASAQDFSAPIESLLTDRGRVSVTRSTNTLVVTDIPQVLDRIADLISGIDVQTPEITISAKIIFVNRTDLEEFGIVYDLKDSRGNQINRVFPGAADLDGDGQLERVPIGTNVVSLGGNSIAAVGNANQRVSAPAAQFLTSLVIGRHTLLSFVEALSSVSLSDIQAHPQVRVLENETAEILVGERTPIPVVQQTGVAGGQEGQALFQPFTVQFQETGIKLEVTPQVTAGNLILMDLKAERSGVEIVESILGFVFNTQEATTKVLVEDGETVVIGGLTVTEVAELRSGIPLLMNLPLVGRFFRLTREEKSQRDLIILVTPQINRR
jgi:type IV pilus assembly protein PilQ